MQQLSDEADAVRQAQQKADIAEANARASRANSNVSPGAGGTIRWGGGNSSSSSSSSNHPMQAPQLLQANHTQAEFDPWSKYRAASGDMLNAQNQNDPSNFYRDKLQAMSAPGGGDFQTSDPSYLFRLQQGQQALERSGAAKGLQGSGNMGIALQNYGQNAASQEFGAQFERMKQGLGAVSSQYDTQMQRLMKMAGIDNDPAAAAKMNLGIEGENTNRIQAANQYNLGVMGNETSRYGIDVGAETSRLNSQSRGGGSIDTQSLFAGKAASAVESANWWANKDIQNQNIGAAYGYGSRSNMGSTNNSNFNYKNEFTGDGSIQRVYSD
jgi:hypothetical protein